jgi:hypothetical protein
MTADSGIGASGSDSGALEHYCTLFDSGFLPQGLALAESLFEHDHSARLWALCMDDSAFDVLERVGDERLKPIRLADLEEHFGERLLAAKGLRTRGEYCWTLTPFLPSFVLDRAATVISGSGIRRVTYVDADCFFFTSPQKLLRIYEASGADVMLTPHAYAPEYDQSEKAGVYCAQFLPFKNSEGSREILSWWQDRCIEWCYARYEPGRFGDQKYLDEWPEMFGDRVYVLDQPLLTLAPWNAEVLLAGRRGTRLDELCMYHFHGLRFMSIDRVQLHADYRISRTTFSLLYPPYVDALERAIAKLEAIGFVRTVATPSYSLGERYSRLVHWMRGELRTSKLKRA